VLANKKGLNNDVRYKSGCYGTCHTHSIGNSKAILTLSAHLANSSLSLGVGGLPRLDSPSGLRAHYARSTGTLDATQQLILNLVVYVVRRCGYPNGSGPQQLTTLKHSIPRCANDSVRHSPGGFFARIDHKPKKNPSPGELGVSRLCRCMMREGQRHRLYLVYKRSD
jgi:hypothetical protein